MAASLLLACNLNEQQVPRFVFLREDSGVDGTFVISSILGQRLKVQNTGTILLCLHNTFQHYSSAGIRLGYNLSMSRDRGALTVIEPIADVAANLFDSVYLRGNEDEILETLWSSVEQAVSQQLAASKHTVTLIVDNLSWLIDLGVRENSIVNWCRKLAYHAPEKLSVVVKINTCQLFDVLCCNLEDLADVEVQIIKLKSGAFKEVDGRIVCVKRSDNAWEKTEKTILYKVNDRNVRIFAPGEVGAKAGI